MTEFNRGESRQRDLSAGRRALLEERLRGRILDADIRPLRRKPGEPLPLTPLQSQIWALAQSHPLVPAYNMRRVLRFTGNVDVAALRHAIAVVVQRHEALRTVFAVRGRDIVQIAQPGNAVELDVETPADCVSRAAAEIRRPFDLACGPLVRFLLLEEAPQRHLFLLVVHHIIADEWSLDIIFKELNTVYNGQEPEVAHPLQYGDYVTQKLTDIDQNAATHVDFWRNRLAGTDHSLHLPYDYPRLPVQKFEGDFSRIEIHPELITRLKELAARLETTLFVLLYTAYTVLLSRLSGQVKFAVGVPSANRLGRGAETAVGLFVASLPLSCDVEHDTTVRQCVKASRQNFLDAMMNLDFAFEDLLSAIQCERGSGGNPLFQTMFVLETDSLAELEWSGLDSESVEINGGCSKFDLTLFVDANLGSPTAAIEFDTALFDPATAQRILLSYAQLLENIAVDPDVRVDQVDVLSAAMREALVSELGSGPAIEFANEHSDKSLPGQILKTAEAMPDAIAAEFGNQRLTYRELLDAAGRLAARLRARGVGSGDMVGVFADRSIQQLVGILGTQFAGAAYVPIDPGYPPERIDIVFEDLARSTDGRRPQVVTVTPLAGRLPQDISVLLIDADDDVAVASQSVADVDPESPAYVIYTSGSTGKPKGVVVSHANLTASTAARRQYYDAPKRFLLVPSFAFDSSVAGIFWTLSCGGTLVLAPSSDSRDPVMLGKTIRTANISHTLMLPSLWRWILLGSADGDLRSLESVIVAGEACSRELVDLHHSSLPGTRLYNEYGPTEATVWATVQRCAAEPAASPTVAIGRPIAGTRLYVLDKNLALLPVGVTGELYIGGAGVSDGYLQRPGDTEAQFRPDPYAADSVIYRTGDRVRWRADGALDFLGRVDNQVKLRGYRIEPAEIEARLRAHPDVDECCVSLVRDYPGDDVDIERTIELAERLPPALVERLLSRVRIEGGSK